jgi:hypothetical protein
MMFLEPTVQLAMIRTPLSRNISKEIGRKPLTMSCLLRPANPGPISA